MKLTVTRFRVGFAEWATLLHGMADATLFQQPAWLAFVQRTQPAEPVFAAIRSGPRTVGYFCGLIQRRCGLTILGSPLPGWTTSYMGMTLSPGTSRGAALQAILSWALEDLHCAHVEIMDRHVTGDDLEGLECQVRWFCGFEVDLTVSTGQLFANMTSACRRCIRRAARCGVSVEEAHDGLFAAEYFDQLREVFLRQSLVPPYGLERVCALEESLAETGWLLLLRARDSSGRCIATGIFPAMNGTMYFWGGASRREALGCRPNEALQWYAMNYWRGRGITRYDMGGAGEYKRKFGGKPIAVPWIRKSRYRALPILRSAAKKVEAWRQRILAAGVLLRA